MGIDSSTSAIPLIAFYGMTFMAIGAFQRLISYVQPPNKISSLDAGTVGISLVLNAQSSGNAKVLTSRFLQKFTNMSSTGSVVRSLCAGQDFLLDVKSP